MHIDFIGLTLSASLYVVFNIFLQSRPPIGLRNKIFSPCNSRVSSCRGVVEFFYNLLPFCRVACYHQSPFFVPLSSKLLKPMCICPFPYGQHLLFIPWFFNDQATDEQGVREDRDVFVIA